MEPMKPMKPMEPMQPMARWWPEHLGEPASSGGQNEMRYAFFPEKRVLLVETAGRLTSYDSGDHRISGVAQQQGSDQHLTFSSQQGNVELDALRKIEQL